MFLVNLPENGKEGSDGSPRLPAEFEMTSFYQKKTMLISHRTKYVLTWFIDSNHALQYYYWVESTARIVFTGAALYVRYTDVPGMCFWGWAKSTLPLTYALFIEWIKENVSLPAIIHWGCLENVTPMRN